MAGNPRAQSQNRKQRDFGPHRSGTRVQGGFHKSVSEPLDSTCRESKYACFQLSKSYSRRRNQTASLQAFFCATMRFHPNLFASWLLSAWSQTLTRSISQAGENASSNAPGLKFQRKTCASAASTGQTKTLSGRPNRPFQQSLTRKPTVISCSTILKPLPSKNSFHSPGVLNCRCGTPGVHAMPFSRCFLMLCLK